MAFQPGQLMYVNYGEVPVLFHTRLILGHIAGLEYMIRTPDGDQYVEIMDPSNPDLTEFHVGLDDGSLPPGVPAGSVYGFPPLTLAQFNAFLTEGRREVTAELGRRGIPVVAPVVEGQPFWALAEMVTGHQIGETVTPMAGFVRDGSWGLMPMDVGGGVVRPVLIHHVTAGDLAGFCEDRIAMARSSEAKEGSDRFAGEDVRTMEVRYGPNGERHRNFRESVQEMVQVDYDDFPLTPRTTLSYVRAIAQVSESAFGQHLSWVSQSRIPDGDRAIYENEVLSRILDTAVVFDALNISNLACFELLVRRKQLLAEAHSFNPSSPSYEGADHYMGTTYRPGGAIVVPELSEHVAKRLEQESKILKEKRKQAELKGKGKGKTKEPAPKPAPKGGGGQGS